MQSITYIRRHDTQKQFEIVSNFLAGQFTSPRQGGICYPEAMVVELRQDQDLDDLLEQSKTDPVLIFKHSTQCSISGEVQREFLDFVAKAPDLKAVVIRVIESRRLSDAVAERLGVRHESPQALLIKDGRVVWHASHWSITSEALVAALRPYVQSAHQRN
jgi:monothiol bacilliredoxin